MKDLGEDRKIILVADDDADDCLLLKCAFIDIGLDWETRFVGDGIELMEYLENWERLERRGEGRLPDLIVLDLNMPRKGGREALREISAHSRFNKIPTVILTTSDEPQDVALCRSLGAKLFITKPNMYTEWLEKVEALRGLI